MNDFAKKEINEIDFYKGEHAIPGIKFRTVGKELGVTAWGMNVIEIEAGCLAYPEHDHVKDGQEEVYVVLRGSATFQVGEQKIVLKESDLIRVGPAIKRKIVSGEKGVTVLALGATPGKAYASR